jgi:hypothetical protein
LEENQNDAHNRRILRRGGPPQSPGDAAALKLLCLLERIPRLDILRVTVCTADPRGGQHRGASTRARRGIIVLELKSADHSMDTRCGLYLRVELALAEVLRTPIEELAARLCGELSIREDLISTLALKDGSPPLEEVSTN